MLFSYVVLLYSLSVACLYLAPYAKLSINSDAIRSKMMNMDGSQDSSTAGEKTPEELQLIIDDLVNMSKEQIEQVVEKYKTKIIFLQVGIYNPLIN